MRKKIAVIGAGISGITTIKQLADEGHDVTCFEKLDNPGGVFSKNEIYDDLHLTVSNYFMSYSDFIPKNQRLRCWSKAEYRSYLQDYMDHYKITDKIRFSTQVRSVRKNPRTSSWNIEISSGDIAERMEFDGIVICSGLFQVPKYPEINGLEEFEGHVHHSKSYRDKKFYEGKRVLCVGFGESAADITQQISSVAQKCTLSLRRHQAVIPLYMPFQEDTYYTIDTSWVLSRIVNRLPHRFHGAMVMKLLKRHFTSPNPDLRLRADWLKKSGPPFHQVVTKNENAFKPIVDGKIVPNFSGIEAFDKYGVIFTDGSREDLDAVVFCTGYQLEFPFLENQAIDMRSLFKQMFIPEVGSSLAFIGFARPQQGGVPTIAEMQARYLAQLHSGNAELPSIGEQQRILQADMEHWQNEYKITPNVSCLVNYCHYMDSMANLVGCMPKIPALWKNPKLRIKLLHGPQLSAQYRLNGPHSMQENAESFLLKHPNTTSLKTILYLEAWRFICKMLFWIPRFRSRLMMKPDTTSNSIKRRTTTDRVNAAA